MGNAFVIVDMLHDFINPTGKLYFEKGQMVVEPIARLKSAFRTAGVPVFYCNDSHPRNSEEFTIWPPHCQAGSEGAQIIPELPTESGDIVLCKDSLSIFAERFTEIILRALGISRLYLTGVATEYCVKSCAMDALARGMSVVVVVDAIAGVDLREGDAAQALETMRLAGARFTDTRTLIADLG